MAAFALAFALLVETKQFPANGWALDIYESAHPGFSALFSAASGTAALFAADKIVGAVKAGALKHFFLVGGCDGAEPGRFRRADGSIFRRWLKSPVTKAPKPRCSAAAVRTERSKMSQTA